MTDQPASKTPLHVQQAEGLRQLADLIDRDPEFAQKISFCLTQMHNYAIRGDIRADLLAFRASALNGGADVVITNGPSECEIRAKFGAIEITRSATAARMSEQKVVDYDPLVVED